MRILQAMAGGEAGGAEAFFVRLAIAFNRAGIEQCLATRRNARRVDALVQAGLRPVQLPFGGRFDMRTASALARQVRTFRPDVVLSWMSRAAQFTGRALRGRDIVHVARLGGYYNLKYYGRCDHLIGNTPDIVSYLVAEGWPADRAHYLPNFVDGAPGVPVDRAALDTPETARVILGLGRLHRNKAFDVLVRALAGVPDAVLWLAGEGPLRGELESLGASCGVAERVRFLGWRDDASSLMAAADVLACPSRIEPLGNVVIEGWAQGLPVVATRSAGPTWLIEGSSAGLLTPLDDHEALAEALNRVLSDAALREELVIAGRKAYEAEFTETAVVKRYLDLFQKVAR